MDTFFLDLAKSKGYTHFSKNKFFFGQMPVGQSKIISHLGIGVGTLRIEGIPDYAKNILLSHLENPKGTELLTTIFKELSSEILVMENNTDIGDLPMGFEDVDFFLNVSPTLEGPLHERLIAIDTAKMELLNGKYGMKTLMNLARVTEKDILENPKPGQLKFNPFSSELILEPEAGGTLKYINTYVAPKWRSVDVGGYIPEIFKKIFNHLFPNPEEREYILDWMHHALVGRNQTLLVLAGPRGTGKNLVMADILGAVIGTEYTEIVGQAVLDEKFNAPLHNKRLVIYDEVNLISNKAVDNVKRHANDRISIEKKGQDAFMAENYASGVILTNDITSLRIVPQERRYSIPEVAEADLRTIMSEPEIAELKHDIANQTDRGLELISAFGHFLLYRKPKLQNTATALKGEYFHKITTLVENGWITALHEYASKVEYSEGPHFFKDILKDYKRSVSKNEFMPSQLRHFVRELGDYKYRGSINVGKVVSFKNARHGRQAPAIIFNKKYLAAVKKDMESNSAMADDGDLL